MSELTLLMPDSRLHISLKCDIPDEVGLKILEIVLIEARKSDLKIAFKIGPVANRIAGGS